MKIALFTDTFLPQINGVTKTLDKLITYFEEKEIEYLVFAPEDRKEVSFEENIERLLSFSFFLYPECRVSVPNYFKIRRVLNEFKPDLIHIVTPFNLGLCGLKYAKSYKIPLVASYHTNFTQYLDYYNLNLLERPIWRFFRWFYDHSYRNFCPSQSTLKELKQRGIKNLEIWDRGIDTETYSPKFRDKKLRKRYGLQNKVALLYVGRLAPEKNLELLMESLKLINRKYQKEVELLLTGDGPLLTDLQEEAPENVTFTGYLTGEELNKVYSSADIFAFPSVTETYGNVILEAMASGLPVVGIPAGGVKENLIDYYNGLACPEAKVEDFAQTLEVMIENDKLRKKLANNARQYALDKSWSKVFNRLISSYQEVITSNSCCQSVSY